MTHIQPIHGSQDGQGPEAEDIMSLIVKPHKKKKKDSSYSRTCDITLFGKGSLQL